MARGAQRHSLKRTLSLPILVLYGIGTTIGAGIYGLLGEVVGAAGLHAPVVFIIAASLAGLSALSFCELAARFPQAGGEAVYVGEGFASSALTRVVGVAIAVTACLSAATVTRGFAGHATAFLPAGASMWVVVLLLALGALAAWGIEESARLAAALTLIEVGGLLIVIFVCREGLATAPDRLPELLVLTTADAWRGVSAASLLCFYSFLGFEDMVNVAEEVREVRRAMPRAILITLAATLGLYLLLSTAAVLTLSPERLSASDTPLAELFAAATGRSGALILGIGVLAMLNGALIQLIKAARILYGLGSRGELPRWLADVHPGRGTPLQATAVAVVLSMLAALTLPIAPLARLTSFVTLSVFALTNVALLRIKRQGPGPADAPAIPVIVPMLGAIVSTGFLILEILRIFSGGAGP